MDPSTVSGANVPEPPMSHWHAGYNQPGYLPVSEPGVFSSFEAARESLAEDMESHAASEATWAHPHDCDDAPCPTYGESCPWDRAQTIRAERDELVSVDGFEWHGVAADTAYWITRCERIACVTELVAGVAEEFGDPDSPLLAFAESGAVLPGAMEEADEHRQAASAVDQSDLELLCAYLAAVGEQGPVSGWPLA
jgi:hypothetical protein